MLTDTRGGFGSPCGRSGRLRRAAAGQEGWEVARAPVAGDRAPGAGAGGGEGGGGGGQRAWIGRRRGLHGVGSRCAHGNPFRRNGVAPTGTPCRTSLLALAVAVPASAGSPRPSCGSRATAPRRATP